MQVTAKVESLALSKTGKSYRVKLGTEFVGADLTSGIKEGDYICATLENTDFGKWIQGWNKVEGQPVPAPSPAVQNFGGAVSPWFMPFVSNCVAHAIAAGLIKQPSEIDQWAAGAFNAARIVYTKNLTGD